MDARSFVFRTDSSVEIGTGHVMRCLALAAALRKLGADVRFICREHDGNVSATIEERGFAVDRLPAPGPPVEPASDPAHAAWVGVPWLVDAEQTIRAMARLTRAPGWVIVDHYGLDARWERHIGDTGPRLMAIDDLADRPHQCQLLLDHNLVDRRDERYDGRVPEDCKRLLGPGYALIQEIYGALHPEARVRDGPIRRILISFGGADRHELTMLSLNAIRDANRADIEVDIVLPGSPHQFEKIRAMASANRNIRLHDRVPSLAHLILDSDLALGAGGVTSWERLCLGLPALVITTAGNQIGAARELNRLGLIRWIGAAGRVGERDVAVALAGLLRDGLDPDWSRACLQVVDGRGADRTAAVLTAGPDMPMTFRPAVPDDESLLLAWANDRETRRNGFSPAAIAPAEHKAWFREKLRSKAVFYIAEAGSGIPLGQVRFEPEDGGWEISYALAPEFRRLGLGRPLVERSIGQLRAGRGHVVVRGQVKPDNGASRRIFESLGFSILAHGLDRYLYERAFGQE